MLLLGVTLYAQFKNSYHNNNNTTTISTPITTKPYDYTYLLTLNICSYL